MNCLHILETKPWSVASFANIFSHSVGVFSSCLWFSLPCKIKADVLNLGFPGGSGGKFTSLLLVTVFPSTFPSLTQNNNLFMTFYQYLYMRHVYSFTYLKSLLAFGVNITLDS